MKNFFLGVLATLVALTLSALACVEFGLVETRADIPPRRWEARLMYSAVHASVRQHAPKLENPVPPTDENLIKGGRNYLDACAGCHGELGKSASDYGATFYPAVPQLSRIGTQYSEAEMFWVVKHGIRHSAMSAWAPFASDKQIWQLVGFLHRIDVLPPVVKDALATKKQQ
jgi:mono/diheme cytochrome c family protein